LGYIEARNGNQERPFYPTTAPSISKADGTHLV